MMKTEHTNFKCSLWKNGKTNPKRKSLDIGWEDLYFTLICLIAVRIDINLLALVKCIKHDTI